MMHKVTHYNRRYIYTHKVRQGLRQATANTQTSQTGSRTNKLKQKVVNRIKVICFELPLQGCHAFCPFWQNAFLYVCVRGTCKETSNYTAYYIAIKRHADKRPCFKTGNTVRLTATQTGRQVAGSQRGTQRRRVRHRQTDSETGFEQGDKEI